MVKVTVMGKAKAKREKNRVILPRLKLKFK
jgi:hypothetical protein